MHKIRSAFWSRSGYQMKQIKAILEHNMMGIGEYFKAHF